MIADELDATRAIDRRHLPAKADLDRPGLMVDLDDLGMHAAKILERVDQLRDRLGPVLAETPAPGSIADEPADLTPAQHRVRAIAVTLHQVDDQISFLLDGIRL